ncbi:MULTISPECIES: LysR family transcriptional regulator [unclassified Microbacterium]|uniref:LysR family transcriptional regulator n=1 Tax=Microbacterium TaxID=33882 RepID=UPI003BA1B454
MDVNELDLFIAVAESGSVSGAAERLHTVQSNVSARLRALETRVGAQLAHRHARGITLTSAGELFLPYARRIVHLMQEGISVLADVDDPTGPLALGAMETTAGWRLPQLLSRFTEQCPNVDVSLRTGTTDELIRDVTDHRLQGAFVSGPVAADDLEQRTVFIEDLVLVTARRVDDAAASLLAHVADLSLPMIGAVSLPRLLVFRQGCSYRNKLIQLTGATTQARLPVVEFGSLEGILGCVAAGMGVTLLPAAVVQHSAMRNDLRLHTLPAPLSRAETVFIRRADSPLGPAMHRFIEELDQIGASERTMIDRTA